MKSFDELKLEALQQKLENRKKKWLGVAQKLKQSNDPVENVDLEEKKQDLEEEIKALEKTYADLSARQLYRWKNSLHKIDFDQAEEALRPVIRHYKGIGKVALLLLQESSQMMGEYCVSRLKAEWLSSVNETVAHIPIRLDTPDESTIIRRLAEYLEIAEDALQPEEVLRRHCKKLESGLLFITFQFSDTLKRFPQFLSKVRETLLKQFEDILCAECEEYGAKQVLIMLVAENELHPAAAVDDHCCSHDDFDPLRILHIPTEEWSDGVIQHWLKNLSGLRLGREVLDRIVAEVAKASPDRLPRNIDTALQNQLKLYTEQQ